MNKDALKLTINERLYILQMLPKKGNELDIFIIKDIQDKVDFNDTEKKDIKYSKEFIPNQGNVIAWDKEQNNTIYEIEFSSSEKNFFRSRLDELSKNREIRIDWFEVVQKIRNLN